MLRNVNYTENDIANYLKHSQHGLFGSDATPMAESEQELLAFLQSNARTGVRTTLKTLLEKFERKPYGWYFAAVLCTLAKLCVRGKVEVRTDSNLLEEDELEQELRNTHSHGNLILEPQIEFTASQVRALKEFYEDFFDAPPQSSEARALGKETGSALQELVRRLHPMMSQVEQYPFLDALSPVVNKLKELTGKPYTWYLTELHRQEETLFKMKEGIFDPIIKFMSGPQKGIFDSARKFIQTQEPNFTCIEGNEADQIVSALSDPECFKGNRMQHLKNQIDALREMVAAQVEIEIVLAKENVEALQSRLCSMPEFSALSNNQKDQINQKFSEFVSTVERQKLIAVIRDTQRRFEENEYPRLLALLSEQKTAADSGKKSQGSSGIVNPIIHDPFVAITSLRVPFDSAWLADEATVERYLESMRRTLLEEIRKGKRIQI
jgi:hypothetical protein